MIEKRRKGWFVVLTGDGHQIDPLFCKWHNAVQLFTTQKAADEYIRRYFPTSDHHIVAWLEFDPKADEYVMGRIMPNTKETRVCP